MLLDLSLDAIAIRRGYWQWNFPLNAGWFGVPAGNLYAWMFVVFFFFLLCRFVRRLYVNEPTPRPAEHVRKRETLLGRWVPVAFYLLNWFLWLLTGIVAGAWELMGLASVPLPALGLYMWHTRRARK